MLESLTNSGGRLVSVISLETEDTYFATPLNLSRLGLPARQEKFPVLARNC